MPRKATKTKAAKKKAAKKKAPKRTSRTAPTKKMMGLGAVAQRMKDWQPASEALTSVRSVETIFPQFNAATGIGGYPLQRVCIVHGPSTQGKTSFVHGIGMSFLQMQHYYGFIDAEFTTTDEWVTTLMKKLAKSPGFLAMRPKTYEQTVDAVREMVEGIAKAVSDGDLPSDTSAFLAVDSIRKLVPKRLREILEKEGADESKKSGGIDGMSGRAGQYKASLNAAWLDELGPLLYHTNTTMALIGREAQKQKENKYDVDWKLTGGGALTFDSSLSIRMTRTWVKKGDEEIGERIRGRIYKSKIAGKEGKVTDFFFHTSNGRFTPAGFDRPRDIFEMARQTGVVTQKGTWFTNELTGDSWQGENAAILALSSEPTQVEEMLTACKEQYAPDEIDISEGEEPDIDLFQKANG